MKLACKYCKYTGEATWRDGKYYCGICGRELDIAENYSEKTTQTKNDSHTVIASDSARCPICMNDQNNTYVDGKICCSVCNTVFIISPRKPSHETCFASNESREKLENDKKLYLTLCAVFCFICWTASVYFGYKWYQTDKKLKTS